MENVYSTAKPFYILAKILGLFPLSFVGPKVKGVFRTKWHGVLSSILSISFLIFLIVMNCYDKDNAGFDSAMLKNVWHLQALFELMMIFCNFMFQIRKRHLIVNFLEDLDNIDVKVQAISNFKRIFAY